MSKKGQSNSQLKTDRLKGDWKALEIVHPHAAGIDIGGSEHWVAINPERDEQPVQCFDCFTADLEYMADWLVDRGVRSVAMQSTGVYWIPVFEILQQHGLEVYLVKCAAYQEPAWAEERYCGMSVAVEAAHIRTAEQQLSAQR